MTTSAAPFDSRLARIFTEVKSESQPQNFYHQKATEVRLERIDGVVAVIAPWNIDTTTYWQ